MSHHHDHDHEHDHEHHHHDHEHHHDHHHHDHHDMGSGDVEKETRALISYMTDHNKHHADELLDMAEKLKDMDKSDAADKIEKAAEVLNGAVGLLEEALSLM